MINNETIHKMKDGVVLINCARGPLMDIDALINNIENCKIGALGLDCIEEEESIVHKDLRTDIISNRKMAYLRQFPNVVHTQHMAFYTGCCRRQHGLLRHSRSFGNEREQHLSTGAYQVKKKTSYSEFFNKSDFEWIPNGAHSTTLYNSVQK